MTMARFSVIRSENLGSTLVVSKIRLGDVVVAVEEEERKIVEVEVAKEVSDRRNETITTNAEVEETIVVEAGVEAVVTVREMIVVRGGLGVEEEEEEGMLLLVQVVQTVLLPVENGHDCT